MTLRQKLTKTSIESIPLPESGDTIVRDTELRGFGVRITSKGTKSYFVERMVNGRNARSVVGRVGGISVSEARAQAQATLAGMSRGIDPIAERRKAKEIQQA